MKTKCTHCQQAIKAPEKYLGKRVKCPKCGEPFTVRAHGTATQTESQPAPQQSGSLSERISLETSLLSILKSTPAATVSPFLIVGWLVSSAFSPTSLIIAVIVLGMICAGYAWNVYSHQDCWIQFDREGFTFCKNGKQHTCMAADLKSVKCPTVSQRHLLDYLQLKFRSPGPVVAISKQNQGFVQAKQGFKDLLERNPSVQYSVAGDFDLFAGNPSSDEPQGTQELSARPNSPIFLKIYAGIQIVGAASFAAALIGALSSVSSEKRTLLLVASLFVLTVLPAALLTVSAACLWNGKKFGWWFTSFLFTKGLVGAAAGILSGQTNVGVTTAVGSCVMLASMFRQDALRYFRLNTEDEPEARTFAKALGILGVLGICAWAGTSFILPRMAEAMAPAAVTQTEALTDEEQALMPEAARVASRLAGREVRVTQVRVTGDQAHIICGTGLEFDLRRAGTEWQLIPTSINDDDMRRAMVQSQKMSLDQSSNDITPLPTLPLHLDNVRRLGPKLNSSSNEKGPVVTFDGLSMYFGSSRPGGYGQSDIYVATRATPKDAWGPAKNLGPSINGADGDEDMCLSADGLSIIFQSNRVGGHGNYDLWEAHRRTLDSPWSPAINLGPTINGSSLDCDPSLSADGLDLYFGSPRYGSMGDFDIWVARRKATNEPWEEPVNLGAVVNSPYGDTGPSISNDGLMLLFNSYRPGGHGGSDLWLTTRKSPDEPWQTPINLGPNVNTRFDETEPHISLDTDELYFCDFSNPRPGSSGWDLWMADVKAVAIPVNEDDVNSQTESADEDSFSSGHAWRVKLSPTRKSPKAEQIH